MKIYISSDMEGSTGVVSAAQVDCTKPQYAFGKAMQAADVAAWRAWTCLRSTPTSPPP